MTAGRNEFGHEFPGADAEERKSTNPDGSPREWNSLRLCWVVPPGPAKIVRASDDDIWEMTMVIGSHRRLDPHTKDDRCACGHKLQLGRMFSHHIAQILAEQGWVKR